MDNVSTGTLFFSLLCLLMLSGFFSGSETALMILNRYRLKHLADEGHAGAKRVEKLLSRPDRLIGLILLGNNFVNILASSISTIIALRLGGEGAIAIAAGLLTLVVLIFSEVTPKTLAALHPEKVAFPAAMVYTPLLKLLFPLVLVVNYLSNGILMLLKIRPNVANGDNLTQEELRTVVNEAGALIPQKHRRMLLNILDLGKATVEDIMIPRHEIDGIDLDDPLDDILDDIRKTPYTVFLAFRRSIDHISGYIHTRTVMQALMEGELSKEKLTDLIVKPYYIPEGTPLNQQLRNFQVEKKRVALVVDEYGDLLGLVTLNDLLEEIVGEFTSDPADSISSVNHQEDGSYLVDGSVGLRELVRTMQWQLPINGPKTLNGLIIEHLENLPQPGISLMINGYPIEIIQTQDNAVKTARILPRERK